MTGLGHLHGTGATMYSLKAGDGHGPPGLVSRRAAALLEPTCLQIQSNQMLGITCRSQQLNTQTELRSRRMRARSDGRLRGLPMSGGTIELRGQSLPAPLHTIPHQSTPTRRGKRYLLADLVPTAAPRLKSRKARADKPGPSASRATEPVGTAWI